MEATTRRRPMSAIVRAASGHPKATAGVLATLFVAGLLTRWATQLWGLPDVGDPFDVAAFEAARVPDNRNAFVEYRYAASMLDALLKRKPIKSYDSSDEWSKADQVWRDLVVDARPALDTWRIGTGQPDAYCEYRGILGYGTLLPVTDKLRTFARLAALEGSKARATWPARGDGIARPFGRAAIPVDMGSGSSGWPAWRSIGSPPRP